MNKIAAGKELTSAEISYLEEKNPQALKEYEQIRAEKENYEKQLERCETKEEVDRLKLTKMGECLSAVRKISSDPYIPDSAKLSMLQGILGKANTIEQAHQEFVRSGRYAALPTEEEERRAKEAEDEQTKAVTEAAEAGVSAGETIEAAEAGVSADAATAGAAGKEIPTAASQKAVMASYEEVKQAVDAALKEQTGKEGHKGRRINQKI